MPFNWHQLGSTIKFQRVESMTSGIESVCELVDVCSRTSPISALGKEKNWKVSDSRRLNSRSLFRFKSFCFLSHRIKLPFRFAFFLNRFSFLPTHLLVDSLCLRAARRSEDADSRAVCEFISSRVRGIMRAESTEEEREQRSEKEENRTTNDPWEVHWRKKKSISLYLFPFSVKIYWWFFFCSYAAFAFKSLSGSGMRRDCDFATLSSSQLLWYSFGCFVRRVRLACPLIDSKNRFMQRSVITALVANWNEWAVTSSSIIHQRLFRRKLVSV